ncbi:PTS system mannose/fructose/N-acetylgalactosamine-transporter subunit IIB [Luxibacter massiliensis]|uniref:PTS system mannose/fructose/N-acetylgalactosamine-transporter subunit IIB n=1 Tax=Luxibacter massiliensis TaxID=2219695 RepID=UPI000F049031|nr:PTS sugar transporter subunit IIB [Luxibacter massiliensis]
MDIVLNRLDERLIHGQLLASWVKKCKAQEIIVVDNTLEKDIFMKSVLAMTLPPHQKISVRILSVEKAAELLMSQNTAGQKTIVLFRDANMVSELLDKGYRFSSLNIGCMSAGAGRKKLTDSVFASRKEIDLFQKMIDMGTDVYIQMVFSETRIHLSDLL